MSIWEFLMVLMVLLAVWGMNEVLGGQPNPPRYWNQQDTLRQVQYRQQTEELRTLDIDSLIQTVTWEKR